MKKCLVPVLLLVFTGNAMESQDEKSVAPLVVKVRVPNTHVTRFRRKAESFLQKAITYTLLQGAELNIKNEKQAVAMVTNYLLAEEARQKNDAKECEKYLLEALPNKLATQELAKMYLEKARYFYQRASETGDKQAGVIVRGLHKYGLLELVVGEKKYANIMDDPLVGHMYS